MPGPQDISRTGWSSYSSHSGKSLPHARCCPSVASIVPLKNSTDSSSGKPQFSLAVVRRELCSFRQVSADRLLWGTSFGEADSSSPSAGRGGCTPVSWDDFRERGDKRPRRAPAAEADPRAGSHAWWAVTSGAVYVQLLGTPTGDSSSEFWPSLQLGLGETD